VSLTDGERWAADEKIKCGAGKVLNDRCCRRGSRRRDQRGTASCPSEVHGWCRAGELQELGKRGATESALERSRSQEDLGIVAKESNLMEAFAVNSVSCRAKTGPAL
jgi:hypothetical protein